MVIEQAIVVLHIRGQYIAGRKTLEQDFASDQDENSLFRSFLTADHYC